MAYVTPLRTAVIWLVGLNRGPFPAETIGIMADVPEDRAAAYASILVKSGALIRSAGRGGVAQYSPGPGWIEWERTLPKSRPSRATMVQSIDQTREIALMRRNIAVRIAALRVQRGWTVHQLARAAGCHHQYVASAEDRCQPPPVCQLALIAKALATTVDDLLASPA